MSDSGDDRDERIRLLEYQVAFLHRELTFVTKRYEDIVYSAAWTLARPVKAIEDFAHRLAKSLGVRAKTSARDASKVPAPDPRGAEQQDRIAARIAAKMERPPAGR